MTRFALLRSRAFAFTAASGLLLALAACGGGAGGDAAPAVPPAPTSATGDGPYVDPQAYSTAGGAALDGAVEAAAATRDSVVVDGRAIAYRAHAGHLIAREAATGRAEASMFYVAYLAEGAPTAGRPVTFFYNGGPGSASVWLHLGSFGPRRLATGVPQTATPTPFPLVDNGQTLLDTTDLVFVDAVGTGLSQAIAPFVNRSFWGVDADAALFRDFVVRWLAAFGRGASPRYLYGESYGGPRTAVLARLLEADGIALDGLILQSPALDYNSNCGVIGAGSCARLLSTYGAIGAWHGVAPAALPDLDAYLATLNGFTAERHAPAIDALLGAGAPPPADLPPLLAGYTGIPAPTWKAQLNLGPGRFANELLPGQLIGRYDGRIKAAQGSALASGGDPSSTYITASFASAIASHLRETLRYSTASTYVLLSGAIQEWNFGHAGRSLPDTVPDLADALARNPRLRVLAVSGVHDLATPFAVTEGDLARLGAGTRVAVRNYAGGHMSYLDDATRVRQKADLVAFYRETLAARPAHAQAQALAVHTRAAADRAGSMPTTPRRTLAEPALQAPLRDPWVPQVTPPENTR